MTEAQKGISAMIGACVIWGLSPIYYKLLAHIPPQEVLAHRGLWSLVFFAGMLALQGRLGELPALMRTRRRAGLVVLASLMISINWFLFIFATQISRNTETSLGYYIYPLVAVLIGRFAFGERLGNAQRLAVALAGLAVVVLTWGSEGVAWISITLALTFGLYGAIKKGLPAAPVVSVTGEVLVFLPVAVVLLVLAHGSGQGAFGLNLRDSALLIASGPVTAAPLILFSHAARRVSMSTVGVLQYINPTLQILVAVAIFAEPLSRWHVIAFALIWLALAIYSGAALRQDRAARRAEMVPPGVSVQVTNPPSDGSAKP